jgi:hypothetical protein
MEVSGQLHAPPILTPEKQPPVPIETFWLTVIMTSMIREIYLQNFCTLKYNVSKRGVSNWLPFCKDILIKFCLSAQKP